MNNFTRRQSKYVKKAYRVRNWAEYEAALRGRGSLAVWLDADIKDGTICGWNEPTRKRRKPGRQKYFADRAIETAIRIGKVLHMTLRQTEGFLDSLFSQLGLNARAPDHSAISKRTEKLRRVCTGTPRNRRPVHLLIDNSGLKVHVGQMRKRPRNRDLRRFHLAVDELTGDILECNLTSKSARDASRVPSLLKGIKRPIASLRADAAYDAKLVYEAAENHRTGRSPRVFIPPKKNAKIRPLDWRGDGAPFRLRR